MNSLFDLLVFDSTLKTANDDVIQKFTGIFPDFVLEEWKNRGFASYMGGLLRITNPEDYYEIMSDLVSDPENCHVIMVTAFGAIYFLKEGKYYSKNVMNNLTFELHEDFGLIIEFTFTTKGTQKNIFYKDIYDKVVKRLGKLEYDEMFGFFPAIALGGSYDAKNVQKVKLKEHLAFLSQLLN